MQVTQNGGGASWSLSGGGNLSVTLNPGLNGSTAMLRYLLGSEMTEQFMREQGRGWYGSGTEGSNGEGLSRFLAARHLAINGLGLPPAGFDNSNLWMASARDDFVNNINATDDGPDAITGCSLLFLYYMFSQLSYSEVQIVAAGATTPRGVYQNLTGDTADPFPHFKALIDGRFPGKATTPALISTIRFRSQWRGRCRYGPGDGWGWGHVRHRVPIRVDDRQPPLARRSFDHRTRRPAARCPIHRRGNDVRAQRCARR